MFLYTHRRGNLITRELAVGLFPFSPWCSILSAERIKCSKADLAMLVCLAVFLALPLVVRFGGFGPLSGQNGAPGRERDSDR